jgi:hypothetical protein
MRAVREVLKGYAVGVGDALLWVNMELHYAVSLPSQRLYCVLQASPYRWMQWVMGIL